MENVTEISTEISTDIDSVESLEPAESVEASTEVSADSFDTLNQIYNDVHLILVFVVITFAMSCFRAWRKNVTKGV